MIMKAMNKIIVTGDYKSFIDKNVIDGKLNFTNMVPKPDDIVKEENNYYIVKYYTDDLLLVFNQDGNSFNCSIDCGNLVAVEYNDFYSWCRFNIGCATDSVEVVVEEISDITVILRFLSPVTSPLYWTMKLQESYPDLSFHVMSMNSTGTFCSVKSEDDKMNIEYVSQSFREEDLNLLDCQIV